MTLLYMYVTSSVGFQFHAVVYDCQQHTGSFIAVRIWGWSLATWLYCFYSRPLPHFSVAGPFTSVFFPILHF